MGVTDHPTKIFADQVTAKVISSIFYIVSTRCALEIHDVARATSCIACAQEMRSSNGRERPIVDLFAALHELASASARTLLKLASSVRALLKPYGDT